MIIFRGQIYATDKVDRALLYQQQFGAKVIYIGEPDPYINQAFGNTLIQITTLTPPYDALQAVLCEDYTRFGAIYTEHLNTLEAQSLIATIVYAIYQGINIVLLFPEDTAELKYPDFLIKFIFTNLGIQVATDSNPFMYNNAFDDIIMDLLYRHDCVSPYEYIYMITNVTNASLHKLVDQLQIKVENPRDPIQYVQWVERFHDRMVAAQKPLTVQPFKCDPAHYKG